MRVVSGLVKGRRIFAPSGLALRPTPNKVRAALFNILSDHIVGASFLDLYAGTGAVGIEALSRGAEFVTFVEQDPRHLQYLEKNIAACGFSEKSRVARLAVDHFLNGRIQPFDLIFLDPPYSSGELEKILPRIWEGDMMADKAQLVVEHFHKQVLPQATGKIQFLKKYRYGETILSFYGKH